MALAQEIEEFVSWHRARVMRTTGRPPAPNTLRTKKSRLRVVCATAGVTELVVLSELIQDRQRVESLLDMLAARMTTGSMQPCVHVLRDFAGYALAKGWATGSALLPGDTPPSNPQKPIEVYTAPELELLVSSARANLRWWAFLATVSETGRRVGEVLALRWDWLNLSADVPHFSLPTSKNKKQQYVPLTKVLRQEVYVPPVIEQLKHEVRTGANRQFSGELLEMPFPWTHVCVSRMLARHCARLGIENRGFHCMRHTKATELLGRGVPLQAVSALLGHSSAQTTDRIYNHATALSFAHYNDE